MNPVPWQVLLIGALVSSCAPAPSLSPANGGARESSGESRQGLELSKSGTLRQEEISVRIRAGVLRIEVTPLVDWVIEATAPDTQRRLASIKERHLQEIDASSQSEDVTLLLVSFSSTEPDSEFQPEDLQVVARGLRERAVVIRPVTQGWGSGRLAQQRTASAVYVFAGTLDLSRDMTIEYGDFVDRSWSGIVPRIEAERGRIPGPFNPLDQTS